MTTLAGSSVFVPPGATIPASTRSAGFWSAVAATAFSIVYVVAQIAEWMGWLGSSGGRRAAARRWGSSSC